jgi:hypothetical protein
MKINSYIYIYIGNLAKYVVTILSVSYSLITILTICVYKLVDILSLQADFQGFVSSI